MHSPYEQLEIFPREIIARPVDAGCNPLSVPPEEWRVRFGAPATGMFLHNTDIPADEPTEVYCLFTDTHLGIGVICREYDATTFKAGKPGFTWDADAHVGVDIYLDPGRSETGVAILSVNPAGGHAQKAFAPGTPCYPYRWQNRTYVTPTYWAAMCWFTFDDLGLSAVDGDVWGLNIMRRDGGPGQEYFGGISLAPLFDGFKFPEEFCRLRFGQESPLQRTAIDQSTPGLLRVQLELDQPETLSEIEVAVHPCWGEATMQRVMPSPTVECTLVHGIADRVMSELWVYRVANGRKAELGCYRFNTPPMLDLTLNKRGNRYGPTDTQLTATLTRHHPLAEITTVALARLEGDREVPVAVIDVEKQAAVTLDLAELTIGAYVLRGTGGSLRPECFFNKTALQPPALKERETFLLTTQTDFPDDMCANYWDWPHFVEYYDFYRNLGMERVYWMEYGSPRDCYLYLSAHAQQTFAKVGDFLYAALIAVKQQGMEFFTTIKPFETGIGWKLTPALDAAQSVETQGYFMLPDRVGGAEVSPCDELHQYPDMFFKRRNWKPPYLGPITEIRLYHVDDHPVEVTAADLTLWVSNDNAQFARFDGTYETEEGVRTWRGRACRYIAFKGLALTYEYIAFTCTKEDGTFVNRVRDYAEALDLHGNAIDISTAVFAHMAADGHTPAQARFNEFGWGVIAGQHVDDTFIMLDYPERDFALAIGRGTDRQLLVPDPSEPQGVEFLLGRVRRSIKAGVDGIKFRLQHHHTYMEPYRYGYSRSVIAAYAHRYGVDITKTLPDPKLFEEIHGDYYTDFYRKTRELTDLAGVMLELQVPETQGFMCELPVKLQWERWIILGLADAIELKNVYPGTWLSEALRVLTRRHGMPLYQNPYADDAPTKKGVNRYRVFLDRVRDAEEDGFLYYESWGGYRRSWDGREPEEPPMVQRMSDVTAQTLKAVAKLTLKRARKQG